MTKEELIKEAISRGYRIGTRVNSLGGSIGALIIEPPEEWYMVGSTILRANGVCMLYSEDPVPRWATIVGQNMPDPDLETCNIFNYEG